jgi:hypothetical protein
VLYCPLDPGKIEFQVMEEGVTPCTLKDRLQPKFVVKLCGTTGFEMETI